MKFWHTRGRFYCVTVYTVGANGAEQISYSFDDLSRLSSRTITPINKAQTFAYKQGGYGENSTTTQVESVTADGVTTSYSYDTLGNITAIYKNGVLYESYEYDSLSQLTKVTCENGDIYEYFYDASGNITSVKLNGTVVKSYGYTADYWSDRLTSFNGESITFDTIGNPLTYRNGMNFAWQNGRRLSGITKGTDSISYGYNADGTRISKTVNGVTTNYTYIDGRLIGEKTGNNTIIYLYDENGSKYGFTYNGVSYYYNLNLQGDVIGIYDASGNTVVEYSYNVWGELLGITGSLADTIGQINPIRYRGYYYDAETGFYYVSSRYYDPEIGRWINADNMITTGSDLTGLNIFAYCGNNPVNRVDLDGHAWKDVKNWFSNTWNNVKKTAKQIVETVKEKVYTAYYNATKWHFEDREKKNGTHPTYSEVNDRNSGWNLLPESQSIYHDNGVGKSELKYITDNGREAVFNGDTLEPVTDPRYIATYNYCPLYQMPSTGAGVLDYVKLAGSGVGHFFADMVPYYLTGNSNTRKQFESKVFLFD